jgi:hypothetical protein
MIVYEVGSIIAVKESHGSRILHGFNAIGINGHPTSRSATRLMKKLRRRANKCAKRWLGQRRSYLTRPRATPLRRAPRELKKRGAPGLADRLLDFIRSFCRHSNADLLRL